MFSYADLTPREKMRLAREAFLDAEREEAELQRHSAVPTQTPSNAPSVDQSVDEDSLSRTSSLRSRSSRSSNGPPSAFHLPATPYTPSSPAPSLPLPPLPSPSASLRDFNPNASTSHSTRQRSRLPSDHARPSETASLGCASPSRMLRRESSIEGLRYDIASASRSFRVTKRTSTASTTSSINSAWSKRSSSYFDGEDLLKDPELAFLPQALPYPKIGRSLARLSTTSSLEPHSPRAARLSVASTISSPGSLSYTPSSSSSTSLPTDIDSPLVQFGGLPHSNYPSPFAAMGVAPRRRSSLATHVLQVTEEDDGEKEDGSTVWVDLSAPTTLAKPVLAPAAEIQVVEEILASPPMSPAVKTHQRNDSTLSAIMAFPIPPDRIEKKRTPPPLLLPEPPRIIEDKLVDEPLPYMTGETVSEETQVEEQTQPLSPQLGDLLKSVTRAKRRRTSVSECDGSETDESDIDMAAPLIQAALSSKILTPRSRLLRQRPSLPPVSLQRPAHFQQRTVSSPSVPLRSFGADKGWSGSESEEEGWQGMKESKKFGPRRTASAAAALRRASATPSPGLRINVDQDLTPKSSRLFPPSSTDMSPSLTPTSRSPSHKRLSSLSTSTAASTELPQTPMTSLMLPNLYPSSAHSVDMHRKGSNTSDISVTSIGVALAGPGDFPWGASSPPNSPVRAAFRRAGSQRSLASSTSFSSLSLSRSTSDKGRRLSKKDSKIFTKRQLPAPRQEVEGWGKPEILLDDETWAEDDSPTSVRSYSSVSSRASLHRGLNTIHLDEYSSDEEPTPLLSSSKWDATPRPDRETPKPGMGAYGRVPSPEIWMNMSEVASLMDEGLDGMESDGEW
ncbi:hypothetical protein B9479_004980 [Cryptococcus floricola]|uniref:Uncharacterized protein n=1 Tax=Cryptococcus floricola TaxID=2591691 RepID=A0A5D3AU86_9TREE|nr:hypothetical protein B9479_004980 [Cryptococcus floricola]